MRSNPWPTSSCGTGKVCVNGDCIDPSSQPNEWIEYLTSMGKFFEENTLTSCPYTGKIEDSFDLRHPERLNYKYTNPSGDASLT